MKANLSSIAVRLPAAIAALCVTVAVIISYVSYTTSRQALADAAEQKLRLSLAAHDHTLTTWLEGVEQDLILISASDDARDALRGFAAGWDGLGANAGERLRRLYIDDNANPAGQKDQLDDAGDGSDYSALHAELHPYFRRVKDLEGYYDIFLIAPDGRLVYSVFKETDYATNLKTGPHARTGLGRAFAAAMEDAAGKAVFSDFEAYAPSAGAPAAFIAVRVADADGKTLGVLAYQMPVEGINAVALDAEGLGETGHITLVGPDLTTRNASRHEGEFGFFAPVPQSEPLRAALAGEQGFVQDVPGEDGEQTVLAYSPVDFLGIRWAMLVEQDESEVFAPVDALRRRTILLLAAAVALSLVTGWLLGRSIARPLMRIGQAMDRVRDEDFTTEVPFAARGDEVGAIARNLEGFRDGLAQAAEAARLMVFKGRSFSGAAAALMVVDRDLRIIDYNESLKALFRENLDALREHWSDFDPDNLKGQCIDRFHKNPEMQRRLLADPANLPHEAEIVLGEARISLHIAAVHDDDGVYVGNSLEWEDIREVRVNRSIIEAIRRNQVMIEYDTDFRVTAVNDNFTKVFGWGAEMVGKEFEQLFGPNEDTRIQMDRLRNGLTVQRKVERPTKDGSTVWVEISMNPIRDRTGQLDRVVEIASDVTSMEQARIAAEEERERQVEAQIQVVDGLRAGLSALAEGDLTRSLEQKFAPDYEQLRSDFNAALTKLTEVMAQLVAATGNINSGAVEISQAADDLSRRTENQAATLEETAAALDELTASVRSATDGATEADRAVRSARENAEESGQVVLQAVDAMSEIEKSSEQISQIIGVIDDIAFQTNLLALNAGVEAARAGEAGRGFAVVASEVRSLAQRSSEAAKEIKTLISASSGHVERGVSLVGQAGDALRQIVDSVANISTLVSDIAGSSKEQSVGLSEINTGVNQLDQVTQQNAAMVEQSTAASHSLRSEAEVLSELVGRFRIRPGGSAGSEVIGLSAARSRPRPEPASRNAAASAPTPTGTDGGWEDF